MSSKLISSATARLAATYLAIMLLMSFSFSVAMYNVSSREFDRPAPRLDMGGRGDLHDIFHERAETGRHNLLVGLIILNSGVLLIGSVLSLWLARRSLEPIEAVMEAQSQFVSDASHELRTPLTAIRATNEVALRNPKLSLTAAKDVIAGNTEEVIKLQQLSDGLLNLAKQEHAAPLQLQAVALPDVVTTAINQVIPAAQAKKIQIHDQVGRLQVQADAAALTQILVILLDNAIKYGYQKGNVWLATQTRPGHVQLIVKDDGPGINAKDLPHIFRRFYRADIARTGSAQNGYGLGLPIAKSLASQIGAELHVSSKAGQGASFSMRLRALSKS